MPSLTLLAKAPMLLVACVTPLLTGCLTSQKTLISETEKTLRQKVCEGPDAPWLPIHASAKDTKATLVEVYTNNCARDTFCSGGVVPERCK